MLSSNCESLALKPQQVKLSKVKTEREQVREEARVKREAEKQRKEQEKRLGRDVCYVLVPRLSRLWCRTEQGSEWNGTGTGEPGHETMYSVHRT